MKKEKRHTYRFQLPPVEQDEAIRPTKPSQLRQYPCFFFVYFIMIFLCRIICILLSCCLFPYLFFCVWFVQSLSWERAARDGLSFQLKSRNLITSCVARGHPDFLSLSLKINLTYMMVWMTLRRYCAEAKPETLCAPFRDFRACECVCLGVSVCVCVSVCVFHNNTFFSNDVYVFAIEDHDAEIVADFFSGVLGHF